MDIYVKASTNRDSINFKFHGNFRSKKIEDLEKSVIQVTKAIFKNQPKLRNFHEIHINANAKELTVTLIGKDGKKHTIPISTQKEMAKLKELSRGILGQELHITIEGSEKLTKLMQIKTPSVTTRILENTQQEQLPEPVHLRDIETAGPEGKNLFHVLQQFFIYHLLIKPSITTQISRNLTGMPPIDFRNNFINLLNESNSWIETVRNKYPDLDKIYSSHELQYLYEKKLTEQINDRLTHSKIPPLTSHEIHLLKIRDVVISLQQAPPTSRQIEQQLSKIQAHEMPFEELTKIPVTTENRETLENLWVGLFAQLYTNGRLDHLGTLATKRDRLIQANNARMFMEAYEMLNEDLAQNIDYKLRTTGITPSITKLNEVILANSDGLEGKVKVADPEFEQQQQIYKEVIKPSLNALLSEWVPNLDGEEMIKLLCSERFGGLFITRIHSALNVNQRKLFRNNELSNLFYHELEAIAMMKYSFTPTQIENFQAARLEEKNQDLHKKEINEIFQEYRLSKSPQEFEQFAQEILNHPIKLKNLLSILQNLIQSGHKSPLMDAVLKGLSDKLFSDEKVRQINRETDINTINREMLALKRMLIFMKKVNKLPLIENQLEKFHENLTNAYAVTLLLDKKIRDIPFDEMSDLICNPKIIDEIENESFDHPSKIPPKVASALLQLSQFASLSKKFPIQKFSDAEKNKIANLLEVIRKTPNIDKILAKFEEEPVTGPLEELIPSALRGLFIEKKGEYYKLPAGVSGETLNIISEYIKMVNSSQKQSQNLAKADALILKYQSNPKSIRKNDRLTISEVGEISKLARYHELVSMLPTHPNLKSCRENVMLAKAIMDQLETILIPEFSEQYQDGDILGYNGKKKEAWMGRSLSPEEKLTMHIAEHSLVHGMKVFRENKTLHVAHVYGQYETRKMNLFEAFISDGWRIDITRLIPSACAKELEKLYGDEWSKQVQKLYHETELAVLNKTRKKS